jgi:hypothetical protein
VAGLLTHLGGHVVRLQQQREQLGGAGQPAERQGPEQVPGGTVVLRAGGEDLGHPGEGGVHPGRVAGGHPGDDVAQPGRVGARQRDVAAPLLLPAALVVRRPVGLDDLGLGDRDHAAGRLPGDRGRHRLVDQVDHVGGQPPGQRGHLARDPRLGLQVAHQRPDVGQAVPQVEHVGDRGPGRERVHAASDPELAQRQLPDPGRALATDPLEPITARRSRQAGGRSGIQPRIACVQVRPVRHQQQVLDLDGAAVPHTLLERRQRGAGVELVDRVEVHASFYSHTCSSTRLWATSGRAPRAVTAGCPAPAHLRRLDADSAHICADSALLLRRRW